MYSSRLVSLAAFATLLSLAVTDSNSVCLSYGVDFVDEGHYFINTDSQDAFTCVSTFKGCNEDVADILLIDPNGDEHLCTQVPTTPADTPQLSTCPILKSDVFTGDWIILIVGNNDDGNPFAWERDISLDAGPQVTSTFTSTVTFSLITTPTSTVTSTSTASAILTTGPFTTVTLPSSTAKLTKTSTPKAVTTTATKTFTRTSVKVTNGLSTVTNTVTATCTTPDASKKDKPCTYSPTLIHPAALVTPTGSPIKHRFMRMRKTDRVIDYDSARNRIEAAKRKRALKADAYAPLAERAPDEPILTVTAATPASTTVTQTAAPVTTTESVLVTTTSTYTLPPATVYTGVYTSTVTLPTPTKTQFVFKYTTATTTSTIRATWTLTTTVTPSASVKPCESVGGHIGFGRL